MTTTLDVRPVRRRSDGSRDDECEICAARPKGDYPDDRLYPVHEIWLCVRCVIGLYERLKARRGA